MTAEELIKALKEVPPHTHISVMGADRPVVVLVTNEQTDYVILEERAKTFVEAYEVETPKDLAEYRVLYGTIKV